MISPNYNHAEVEDKIYKIWSENKLFDSEPTPTKTPYCICIPPPNVTGILHMGHALNNTIQDILIRFKRMQGFCVLWMPGIDHAGIATQNVVERKLKKGGLTRKDLGREKFLEKVWQWKEEYGGTILKQLRKLGASCDWRRTRFTMDAEYSKAVKYVFKALYEKGLIYKGKYIINWCPRCETSLSDEEAPYKPTKGKLYYIKYPIENSNEYITVATTRPETMLGDTAVAVNPKDERYTHLIGKFCILPLVNRKIPIIADKRVSIEFGTGAVKITPAHDPLDYEIAKTHNLELVNIMDKNARIECGIEEYDGLDRFSARQKIIKDLKTQDLVEKEEDYEYSIPHCYRCDTQIEPRISEQWFVKMKPLAEPAIKVVETGKIKFYPEKWKKVYLEWMYNIKDWCISRQIWWGHRIPVWYCKDCKELIVSEKEISECQKCKSKNITQDEDVLDTWFSSWLWPFATFGWPKFKNPYKKEDLDYFYPTSCLVTAPEIIFFWVARMIMAGLEFIKGIPFKDVYIHGTVRDASGKKMSKSLGNIIDPLEIINQMGADALRFSLISLTATGQDVFLSKSKFEMGRTFTNKIWNAFRLIFLLAKEKETLLKDTEFDLEKITPTQISDKWILTKLTRLTKNVTGSLENYNFNSAAQEIYKFFWNKFCDWYLEFLKIDLKTENPEIIKEKIAISLKVLLDSLKLLHPFIPFITEEIFQKIKENFKIKGLKDFIMISEWPKNRFEFLKEEEFIDNLCELITKVRSLKHILGIPLNQKIKTYSPKIPKEFIEYFKKLAFLEDIIVSTPKTPYAGLFSDELEIYIDLEGLNLKKALEKLEKEIKRTKDSIQRLQNLLNNQDFLSKAPPQEIEKFKTRLKDSENLLNKYLEIKNAIK